MDWEQPLLPPLRAVRRPPPEVFDAIGFLLPPPPPVASIGAVPLPRRRIEIRDRLPNWEPLRAQELMQEPAWLERFLNQLNDHMERVTTKIQNLPARVEYRLFVTTAVALRLDVPSGVLAVRLLWSDEAVESMDWQPVSDDTVDLTVYFRTATTGTVHIEVEAS